MSENQKRLISKIFFCENCKSLYKNLGEELIISTNKKQVNQYVQNVIKYV